MNKLKKVGHKLIVFFMALILLAPILASASSADTAYAAWGKRGSHTGMVYLRVQLDVSLPGVSGDVDTATLDQSWNGGNENVNKSDEWLAEKALWGTLSWKNSNNILKLSYPKGFCKTPWNGIKTPTKYQDWETITKNLNINNDGGVGTAGPKATNNLVMTFPGYGAGDTVPNIKTGSNRGRGGLWGWGADKGGSWTYDRADDKSPFKEINGSQQSSAANNVNSNLVDSFNQAISDFYSRIQGSPTLSQVGLSNLVMSVAQGYMPASKDSVIKYNQDDGTFDGSSLKQGKLSAASGVKVNGKGKQDINKQTRGGKPLVNYSTPNGNNGLKQTYTYAVVKGSTPEAHPGGPFEGSDEYALSWMDLAIASLSNAWNDDTTNKNGASTNDKNTTVVGDQVNQFLYGILSGIMSFLGIKTVDELVFGDTGNLFRNNTFTVLSAIALPFEALGIAMLGWVGLDAFRRMLLKYLSTNDVELIDKSLGRVATGTLWIIFFPWVVALLIGLDQLFISGILAIDHSLVDYIRTQAPTNSFGQWIIGILVTFIFIWVNIRFTFRYVARAITFGMYYILAPVIFAFDAIKSDGGLFQMGPVGANFMKNIVCLIFQRSADGLGLVLSLTLGRVIFGSGPITSAICMLSVDAMTNALMALFGAKNSSISDIANTGQNIWGKTMAAGAAAAAVAGRFAKAGRTKSRADATDQISRDYTAAHGGYTKGMGQELSNEALNQEKDPEFLAREAKLKNAYDKKHPGWQNDANLASMFNQDRRNAYDDVMGAAYDRGMHYQKDKYNRIRGITKADEQARKGYIRHAGRQGMIGALSGLDIGSQPGRIDGSALKDSLHSGNVTRSLGRLSKASALSAGAVFTPWRWDDLAAAAAISDQVSDIEGGRYSSVGGFGRSVSNLLGMSHVGLLDNFEADGSDSQHGIMASAVGLGGDSAIDGIQIMSAPDASNPEIGTRGILYDHDSTDPKVMSSLATLTSLSESTGQNSFTQADLIDHMINDDGSQNQPVSDLVSTMNANNLSNVKLNDNGSAVFTSPIAKSEQFAITDVNDQSPLNQQMAVKWLAHRDQFTDPKTGDHYVKSGNQISHYGSGIDVPTASARTIAASKVVNDNGMLPVAKREALQKIYSAKSAGAASSIAGTAVSSVHNGTAVNYSKDLSTMSTSYNAKQLNSASGSGNQVSAYHGVQLLAQKGIASDSMNGWSRATVAKAAYQPNKTGGFTSTAAKSTIDYMDKHGYTSVKMDKNGNPSYTNKVVQSQPLDSKALGAENFSRISSGLANRSQYTDPNTNNTYAKDPNGNIRQVTPAVNKDAGKMITDRNKEIDNISKRPITSDYSVNDQLNDITQTLSNDPGFSNPSAVYNPVDADFNQSQGVGSLSFSPTTDPSQLEPNYDPKAPTPDYADDDED